MVPPAKAAAARKRTRKRKRRAASSSSSDLDSSDSDASQIPAAPQPTPARVEPEASSSDGKSSSSDSDSSEDESPRDAYQKTRPHAPSVQPTRRSPTPDPRPAPIPVFPGDKQEEELVRQRFRKFWMSSVADAFSDDLGEIRKEPNLTTPRLALLIDSLANGADVFSAPLGADEAGINEMDVAMGGP